MPTFPIACLRALSVAWGLGVLGEVTVLGEDPSQRQADVVFVATPHDVVAKMLELAKITPEDVVYDLGCGDARIVITAAKKHGCRGAGFDISADRVAESLANVRKAGLRTHVTIEQRDVFTVDLRPASVVTLYLLPEMNRKLIPQLERMKPGSRIVAHDYPIPGMKPDRALKIVSKEDGVEHLLFLWTIPLQPNGRGNHSSDESHQ